MAGKKSTSASTLLEMLIAATCLAGASVGVIASLGYSNNHAILARYRTFALQIVRSNIETAVAQAAEGSLTAGTTTQTLTTTGIPYSVTVTTTVTAVALTDRFTISCKATWTQQNSTGPQTETVKLDTIARSLYAN